MLFLFQPSDAIRTTRVAQWCFYDTYVPGLFFVSFLNRVSTNVAVTRGMNYRALKIVSSDSKPTRGLRTAHSTNEGVAVDFP